MGTRGLYGIRKNGVDKLTYNHWDSYPSCLGRDILKFCERHTIEEISRLFDLIELINPGELPTPEQIEICKNNGYMNLNVSNKNENDWYCLLRNLQGNFGAWDECILTNSYVLMQDDHDFIADSLFCEYAYIINLDENVLEFYVGFQKTKPDASNRYYDMKSVSEGYYPCKMLLRIPLNEIKGNCIKLINEMDRRTEDEAEI